MSFNCDKLPSDINLRDDFRNLVDRILYRIDLLKDHDRVYIDAYLINHLSFRQIAQLTGTSQQVIARHTKKLINNLLSDRYLMIYQNKSAFTAQELSVAYYHFLHGHGYRKIAKELQIPVSQVRKAINTLNSWRNRYLSQLNP